jgi:superfamily II DNA or RNA helicase
MLESGETQVLCNCALLTEGFDCPKVAAIVLCRPTKSRALYAQMVGRGTRLCQGKENCLVVDFNYLTESHDLVVATELFDSTGQDAEVGEIAAELIQKQKGLDLMAAMEQAEKVHKERVVVRVQAREKAMRYARRQYDPASVAESLGLNWRGPKDAKVNKATEGQVGFLTKLKVDGAERMSKNQASTMISFLKRRMDAGLASHKQVSTLISLGVDPAEARGMKFQDASAKLDEILSQRRRRA